MVALAEHCPGLPSVNLGVCENPTDAMTRGVPSGVWPWAKQRAQMLRRKKEPPESYCSER